MSQLPDPSLADIDAVLAHLPVVGAPDFDPGHMRAAEPRQDGTVAAPAFQGSPEMDALIDALCAHGFVIDFDWPEWQPVAEHYLREPRLLHEAGLGTLRKLFTTHVRKEGFSAGHLGEIARSGHLAALLARLAAIRAQLKL